MTEIPLKISKYEIKNILGKGSVGIVYKAYDPYIKRFVALKVLKKDLIDEYEEEFSKRFYKEAQIAGTLKHPNIALIYDAGEYEDGSYICMEYINGIPLNKWIEETQHSFIIENFLKILTQISDALDYAHSQGVIHRDIKPANILITSELQAKILDFGIALFSNIRTTKEGKILGSPHYMAPEQILGHKIDHRVDIFSLGVVAYEAITGTIPFKADTITGIITRIAYDKPDFPHNIEKIGFIPDSWERVFSKVLAKNPSDRYATATLFVKDLSNIFPKMKFTTVETSFDIPTQLEKTAVMDTDIIKEEIIGSIELEEKDINPTIVDYPTVTSESEELISNLTIEEEPVLEEEDNEEIIELQETDTVLIEDVLPEAKQPAVKKSSFYKILLISILAIIAIALISLGIFYKKPQHKLVFSKLLQEKDLHTASYPKDNVKIQKYSFAINSYPAGAEIYQNNNLIGITPLIFDDISKIDNYSIKLRYTNYEDLDYEIVPLEANYSVTLALPLKSAEVAITATLKVLSDPADSIIYVRGKSYGNTPKIIKNLKPGNYEITIEKEGYKKWQGITTVKLDEDNILQVNLEKIIEKPKITEIKSEKPKPPEIIVNPIPIKKVYPSKPSRARMLGDVIMELTISEKGDVENVKIIQSPEPILAAEAVRAAQKWTFKPATKNGKPTKGIYKLVFRFQ